MFVQQIKAYKQNEGEREPVKVKKFFAQVIEKS